jgi:hypothetical protein
MQTERLVRRLLLIAVLSGPSVVLTMGAWDSSAQFDSTQKPLIVANCSPCHIPPKGFKKALDTYDAAKTNIDDMLTRINLNPGDRGFMPFKHPKLSDSTINVFAQWKKDGLLEK